LPASEHLFTVRDDDDLGKRYLDETKAMKFHHLTAQLLFMSQQACHNLQTAVSFLTTWVKKPDEDDWGKLRRVMQYLWVTLYMKLTLVIDIDSTPVIRWWVDASHMMHMDSKGHTGVMISLGKGVALSYSEKHKLNTKSSTESKLVGADAMLIKVLWDRYFLEAQGYTVEQNIVF